MRRDFEYFAPSTMEEALALLGREETRLLGGGTDLLVHLRAGIASPRCLVDLAGLGLSYVREESGAMKIGAMTTIAELADSELVQRSISCLAEAAIQFGAVQTRNMATIGGNLCSAVPSADLVPALLVLDSQVRIASRSGDRELALDHFFTGPKETVLAADEILVEIQIPAPARRTGTSFLKLGRRRAMTLAIASGAAYISLTETGQTVENIRIALGAVAPTPVRAKHAESILQGRELTESLIDDAASAATDEIAPISDVRATAAYRRAVSRVLVRRALLDAWGRAVGGQSHPGAGDKDVAAPKTNGIAQRGDGSLRGEGQIELRVNGQSMRVRLKPQALLADVLRDQLGLTGTKTGCGTGECGACTILLDGRPVDACLMLAVQAQGKEITTIEGLGTPEDLHPLQEAFITHGALQCGFCGPGMLLSAKALLDQNPEPTEQDIRFAIAGNICRCTGYIKIVEAIQAAAHVMTQGGTR